MLYGFTSQSPAATINGLVTLGVLTYDPICLQEVIVKLGADEFVWNRAECGISFEYFKDHNQFIFILNMHCMICLLIVAPIACFSAFLGPRRYKPVTPESFGDIDLPPTVRSTK